MRRVDATLWMALVLTALLAACRSSSSPLASLSTSEPSPTTAPPLSSGPTTAAPTDSASTSGVTSAAPAPVTDRPAPPELDVAGSAGQVIVVTAPAYGSDTAVLTGYQRVEGRWQAVMGPWRAYVGNKGFAPPGQKAEGDGRTPSGTYGFSFFFGVAPDPGVRFEYRQVPDASIVWDEDPQSPTYNLWTDLDDKGGGTDPEGMYQPVAYRHGAVIAYNTARTPGLGSGIFLHASTGRPTAGCVSLPVDQLLSVLRWLDPSQEPRIVMGVGS